METEPAFLVHDVQLYDTLQGLSLQYNVSVGAIKRANELSSESIGYLRTLKIPCSTIPIEKVKVDHFRNEIEAKQATIHFVSTEFGNQVSRALVKELAEANDFDLQRTRRDVKKYIDNEKMVNHLSVKCRIDERSARFFLEEAEWDYGVAKSMAQQKPGEYLPLSTGQKYKTE